MPERKSPTPPSAIFLLSIAVGLTLLKLWLVAPFPLQAAGHANHDDELFVRLAEFIRQGQWLGPYDQFTLAKGPMFSIFLAATSAVGMSLLTAQLLFYQAACLILVWSLRPLVVSRGWLIALLLLLTINPATLDQSIHNRILRQNILPALTFLLLAWLIAWYARRERSLTRLWLWSVLGAIALPAFWLTREEGVWFIPALAIPGTFVLWKLIRQPAPQRRARIALFLLPVAGGIIGVQTVAALNQAYYGVRTTCEFNEPHFKDAFGALLRLKSDETIPFTPVTRHMREQIYAVSPTFAKLEPYFEGSPGVAWANVCSFATGHTPGDREIAIGWTMWALRGAVVEYGGVKTGAEASDFYRQMAAEINQAADDGRLDAGPQRSGFLPPLGPQHVRPWLKSWAESAIFLISFDTLEVVPTYSSGSEEELRRFAAMSHDAISPTKEEATAPSALTFGWHGDVANGIIAAYQRVGTWAVSAAGLGLVILLARELWQRKLRFLTCLAVGLVGSISAMLSIVALINATSFPAINSGYFTACYGLLILFIWVVARAASTIRKPEAP